jgi:hypothetical protein
MKKYDTIWDVNIEETTVKLLNDNDGFEITKKGARSRHMVNLQKRELLLFFAIN